MVRNSVVFPHPDGPTTATTSPSAIDRSSGTSASTAPAPVPNRLLTPATSTSDTSTVARACGDHAKASSQRSLV